MSADDAFSAYGGALNFVEGVKLGVSQWSDIKGWNETVYGRITGFVYFIAIGSPYVTHVKIGYTAGDPLKRLANLQTGCPFKMTLLGFVMGCPNMESGLHQAFRLARREGEWFAYDEFVAEAVDRILTLPYEDTLSTCGDAY